MCLVLVFVLVLAPVVVDKKEADVDEKRAQTAYLPRYLVPIKKSLGGFFLTDPARLCQRIEHLSSFLVFI